MTVSASQLELVTELFSGLGSVSVRRMFGGAGVYAQGIMFAVVLDDVVYLKVDDALRAELEAEGSVPWVYLRDGQPVQMGFSSLPDAALDDPVEACAWGRRALEVAATKQAAKATRKSATTD
jgi:DNA transformation protein